MSYVVTIFTEKHLYRVNIEEGTKYTIGSGEKDAFPMSELGVDGQLGICFHAKKQILKLNAKKIPLSVKEMKEDYLMALWKVITELLKTLKEILGD